METNKRDKLHEIYCMVLENNQANIQILKNQKYLLQQHLDKSISMAIKDSPPLGLIEETDNVLRMITSGKT